MKLTNLCMHVGPKETATNLREGSLNGHMCSSFMHLPPRFLAPETRAHNLGAQLVCTRVNDFTAKYIVLTFDFLVLL